MAHTWTVPATVIRVVDGDTVRLELDLGWHTYRIENCRIAGIDAPEVSTAAGKLAKAYAASALPVDAEVMFASKELDKYGRPLGDLVRNGIDFAELMLFQGHAVRYDGGKRGT
jgi:micrococcal nuclease